MSGLGWPVLSFSLASGAALGCLFLLFRGFSRLLGLKKLGTALLDVLFGGLAGGFVFLCALAVDSGHLRLYQVVPQGLGAWGAVRLLGPGPAGGAGVLQKIFCRTLAPFERGGGVPAGPFSGRKGAKGVSGEIFRKKGEKTRKKDLKNLCIPVYNRNNMGVLSRAEPSSRRRVSCRN